jgi:phosphoglycerate dehydrogenase-like enzyme
MPSLANIVILGDYERALRRFSNWEALDQRAKITIHHEPLQGEALYEAVKDADVIAIVRDRSPFNEALIARLSKLKFLMFTGERNGTLDAATLLSRNIPIACTYGGPSKETTAELTWALILGAAKRLVEQRALLASGGWRDSLSVLPMLSGQRLGIMGLGAIGSRVARVGQAFGMEVVCWSPKMTPERAAAENATSLTLTNCFKYLKSSELAFGGRAGHQRHHRCRSTGADAPGFDFGQYLALGFNRDARLSKRTQERQSGASSD